MKQLFLPVILFVLAISNGQAQYTSAKDSDPEAISMLTKAGQAFMSKNAQVNFKLKVTFPGEEPVVSEGVLYQAGTSYNLELKD